MPQLHDFVPSAFSQHPGKTREVDGSGDVGGGSHQRDLPSPHEIFGEGDDRQERQNEITVELGIERIDDIRHAQWQHKAKETAHRQVVIRGR